mgnify:CR=1 FL=1
MDHRFALVIGAVLVSISLSAAAATDWTRAFQNAGARVATGVKDPIARGSLTGGMVINSGTGGALIRASEKLTVGGAGVDLTLSRLVTPMNIAKIARGAARIYGPLALAELVVEGVQYINGQWQAADSVQGGLCWNVSGPYASECTGWGTQICELPIGAVGHGYAYVPSPEWQNQVKPSLFSVQYLQGQPAPAGWVQFNNCTSRPNQGGYFPVALAKVGSPGYVPATDAQLEDAISDALSKPAQYGKAAGVLDASITGRLADLVSESTQVTGPASVQGPAVSSTTTVNGVPATTTTQTTYNVTYSGDVVTINSTTTTTYPDGSTQVQTTSAGEPGGPGAETPTNPDPALCEAFPDILACQKLGALEAEELPDQAVPLAITPEEGFGSSAGSCPADKPLTVLGVSMAFKWGPVCDFANGIRPVVVAVAWLSAALGFFGFARRD